MQGRTRTLDLQAGIIVVVPLVVGFVKIGSRKKRRLRTLSRRRARGISGWRRLRGELDGPRRALASLQAFDDLSAAYGASVDSGEGDAAVFR
jgi:hypothetical protein